MPDSCEARPHTSRKTSRSRNWNYESPKPHIHRVADRRAHGIAAGSGGVCKGGRNVGAEIPTLGISDSCRCIRANRGFDGSAARAVFHGEVKAPNQKQGNTQCQRADNQRDENGRDEGELDRRGSLLVAAQRFQKIAHGQPNLIKAVRLIGVAKVLATLRPGNIGA